MSMADEPNPSGGPPDIKPGELPSPDQVRPMPGDVMNWEKKSLDDDAATSRPREQPDRSA